MLQEKRFRKRIATENTDGYKVIERGGIAFNPYLLWAGAVACNRIADRGLISPLYPTFRVREGYDVAFVSRILLSDEMIAAYDGISFGSVPRRRRSSVKDFLALRIPDQPGLEMQQKIAAILDEVDARIAARRRQCANLVATASSVFTDMFGDVDVPSVPAGVLMPYMRNGLSPSKRGRVEREVLTLSAVTRGEFDARQVKTSTFEFDPPDEKRVAAGDFLMCRGNGNLSLVGAGVFSREDRRDLVFPDTVIAGRVDRSVVDMSYLSAVWARRTVRRQIERIARTTNGTFKINQKSLAGVMVPVPPLDGQRSFAAKVEMIDAQRALVERALTLDEELLASLQSRAFRGEL